MVHFSCADITLPSSDHVYTAALLYHLPLTPGCTRGYYFEHFQGFSLVQSGCEVIPPGLLAVRAGL
jgi:hypothetical protein